MIRFGDYFPFLYSQFERTLAPQVIQILLTFSFPILAWLIGYVILWPLWVNYVRSKRNLEMKYAVFEIRLPKETFKSPLAMELLLHALHNTSDGNNLKQFWYGEWRPYYSL